VCALPMSRSPAGEAHAQPRHPGWLPGGKIQEVERTSSHRQELLDHLGMQQTPVPTTEHEDDPITAKLMHQNRNALEDITGQSLETLKRDAMSKGLMLHGLEKIL